MYVEIKNTSHLEKLQKKTGLPMKKLVNEILEIHLNKRKKKACLRQELDKLFILYKKKHKIS